MMNKYTKSTRARLEMAERQNRWLTIIAIATIITLLVAAAGGPAVVRDAALEMLDGNDDSQSSLLIENGATSARIHQRNSSTHRRNNYA